MDTVRTFAGSIDDVRLSSEVRSADWIRAQHLSTSNSFVSFGGVETAPAISGVLGNDIDADNDSLTVNTTPVSNVSNGTLILYADGTFTYTPDENYNGPDSFTYEVSDGNGVTDLATATITVNPINDAPVNTVPGSQTVAEETTTAIAGISIADVDASSNNLTTQLQAAAGVMNVTLAGSATISAGANSSGNLTILGTMADINATLASLTYTGNVDVSGTAADTLTVSTSDEGNTGAGGIMHDTDNVQINITAVNDDPVLAAIGDQSVNELATLNFTVSATDVDIPANTLSYSLDATSIAAGMTINASTGEFSWTPAESQDGSHSVTITVTDDGVGTLSDSETFTITVNDINNTPTDLIVTSAAYGGVTMNSDGGNDVYFVADDGSSLLTGLTTVTIEASFSIDTPGADLSPLLSYAAGSNDEELALFLKWDGRIWFGANDNGSNLQSTTGYCTPSFLMENSIMSA